MQRFQPTLLAIWRETCRHLQIDRSAAAIAELLREHLPLGQLWLFALDAEQQRLVTRAAVPASVAGSIAKLQPFEVHAFARLQKWARGQRVAVVASAERIPRPLNLCQFPRLEATTCLVALSGDEGCYGIAVLIPGEGHRFSALQQALIEELREPLSIALQNDLRLEELDRLRRAAESDRRSLLARLGRADLGDTVIGASSGLRRVMERVERIADADLPVLILGETGTGKELIARAIHNGSRRHGGPFVRVNCGAIPRELIDSQLFGHEKGSFTGALESRAGWFERAHGGTLFLDEIGELPLDAQVRFLRVLQDGSIERVGGTKSLQVDVRMVAATHRDLAAMVNDNRFREDLWYRIAVFPILLPPLRDRTQDIPALVEHFVEKAARRFGLPPAVPTEGDIRLLQDYLWPGNVRELGAVIDRAVILGDGHRLDVAASLGFGAPRFHHDRPSTAAAEGDVGAEIVSLDHAMRRHIEWTLRQTRGRIEGPRGAAARLAINPHTLRARMRKLGICWQTFRD
jgi:transcriptional regulator with GAF, ATPase, and Fis domain